MLIKTSRSADGLSTNREASSLYWQMASINATTILLHFRKSYYQVSRPATSDSLDYQSYADPLPFFFAVFGVPCNAVSSEDRQSQSDQPHIQHSVKVADNQRERGTEQCKTHIPCNAHHCLHRERHHYRNHNQSPQLTFLLCTLQQKPEH